MPDRPDPVLFVDMDDTLLATDVTWESILGALTSHPVNLLRIPFWFLRGRPHLKERVLRWAADDPSVLPYHEDVLAFLREEKEKGRTIVLATASREELARRVAGHVRLFDDVLATRDAVNLKGEAKLRAMRAYAGQDRPFDYAGDSPADLPVWAAARRAYLVGPAPSVRRQAERAGNVARVFERPARARRAARREALALRGWWGNLAVFLPLLFTDSIGEIEAWIRVAAVFLAFALATSAVRIWEALSGIDADRADPARRGRPFAAGDVSVRFGLAAVLTLAAAALGLGLVLREPVVLSMLLAYLAVLSVYRLRFRRVAWAKAVALVLLYAQRLLAGAAAGVWP